jgi:hypothetical protein
MSPALVDPQGALSASTWRKDRHYATLEALEKWIAALEQKQGRKGRPVQILRSN